jgi:hypothetical protein
MTKTRLAKRIPPPPAPDVELSPEAGLPALPNASGSGMVLITYTKSPACKLLSLASDFVDRIIG